MKFMIPALALFCGLLTGQASAEVNAVTNFQYLSWCSGANAPVDQANQMLSQNQAKVDVALPTAFKLLSLGDAYADCAKQVISAKTDQKQLQVNYTEDALMMATEARFTAALATANLINISPAQKRSKDERYVFATAAHAALVNTTLIKKTSSNSDHLQRVAYIETMISQWAPEFGSDEMKTIYQGIPK